MARESGAHCRREAIQAVFSTLPPAAGTWPRPCALPPRERLLSERTFAFPCWRSRAKKTLPLLVQADGLCLPFRDGVFDALTVAFGLRNMASWEGALREMARVLRSGGLLLVMDFSLPEFAPLREFYRLYLHKVLPHFAAAITGNKEAYEYLGSSIESFPRGPDMQELVERSGFSDVRAQPLCLGVASIYTARRKAYK